MEEKIFYDEMEQLVEAHKKAIRNLKARYALSNNPYKEGDIIEDHHCIIEVHKIRVSYGIGKLPECYYTGPQLRKDLTLRKDNKIETIYQSNIKKKHM